MSSPSNSGSVFGRELSGLYIVNFCAGISMAVFGMLTATWMEQAGVSSFVIGIVSAVYYLFQIVGAPVAERLLRGVGVRGALGFGLGCACLASPLFVLTSDPLWLGLVRGAAGFGVGASVTASQAAIMSLSRPAQRGAISGLHALAFALGLALGPVVGPRLYEHRASWAALFGAAVFGVALIVAVSTMPAQVTAPGRARVPVFAKLGVPLHAIFAYGFAEAALFSLYPPMLVRRGLSVSQVGLVLATFVVGSIALTLPVARLGDRMGRQRALAGCAVVGILAMLGLSTSSWTLTLALASIAGASVGSSYALCTALVADSLSVEELPSGMALFTIALGTGCVAGPVVTGAVLLAAPNTSLFLPTALVFAALLPRLSLRTGPAPSPNPALEH